MTSVPDLKRVRPLRDRLPRWFAHVRKSRTHAQAHVFGPLLFASSRIFLLVAFSQGIYALAGARIPRELAHSIPVLREIFLNLLIVIMIYVAYWVERLSNWNNAAFDCIHEFHLCHSSCRLDLNSKVLSPGVTSLFMLLQKFIGRLVFAYLVMHKLPYMHACILCTDVKRQIPANHNTNMFLLRPTNTGKNCTNCESR